MEKYAYRQGMELIISELQILEYTAEDKAMLLDYKAAYEHICNKNHKKALQYEQQAVKLCGEITATNPHLAANIYGNIGGLYHSDYTNLVWDMGCIYLQMRDKTNAVDCFKSALNVYSVVWENEPELLRAKVEELRKILLAINFDYTALISE